MKAWAIKHKNKLIFNIYKTKKEVVDEIEWICLRIPTIYNINNTRFVKIEFNEIK